MEEKSYILNFVATVFVFAGIFCTMIYNTTP